MRGCLILLALGFGLTVAPATAPAQTASPSQLDRSLSTPLLRTPSVQPVLVLNQERLLRSSKAGQEVLREERELQAEHRREGATLDAELEAEERELTRLREELSAAEFQKLAVAFDEKVARIRREHKEKSEALGQDLDQRRKAFFSKIVPFIAEIMRERGAGVVLEQRNVLILGPNVDITAEVIARMDKALGLE